MTGTERRRFAPGHEAMAGTERRGLARQGGKR